VLLGVAEVLLVLLCVDDLRVLLDLIVTELEAALPLHAPKFVLHPFSGLQ
jgi:hypothetical protein